MFDLTPQLHMLIYTLYRLLTDAMFAVNNLLLGGSRITLVLRNVLADSGAAALGSLFHELGPLWTVALFAVLIGFAAFECWRFLFSSFRVTTPERFIFVTLLAGYLMASGTVAVQWYNFFRRELGHLTYQIAFDSTQAAGAPLPGGGTPVEPRCDLSSDDPDTTLCTGYEFGLSYLGYQNDPQGENGIFNFRSSHGFNLRFFAINGQVIEPGEIAGKPDWQRTALLASAQEAPLVALAGIPLSIMALLEEIARLLLMFATLAIFSGLAVALIFGAFLPLGGLLSSILQQLIRLLATTATVELIMGLFAGFLWLAQGNAILYVGAGLLALIVDGALLSQSATIVLRSMEQAMHGDVRLGGPEMLRKGGLQQVGQAASMAGGAVDGVVRRVSGHANQREMGPGEAMARLMVAQTAMRALSPLLASSSSSAPGGTHSGGPGTSPGGGPSGAAPRPAPPAPRSGAGSASGSGTAPAAATASAASATQAGSSGAGASGSASGAAGASGPGGTGACSTPSSVGSSSVPAASGGPRSSGSGAPLPAATGTGSLASGAMPSMPSASPGVTGTGATWVHVPSSASALAVGTPTASTATAAGAAPTGSSTTP